MDKIFCSDGSTVDRYAEMAYHEDSQLYDREDYDESIDDLNEDYDRNEYFDGCEGPEDCGLFEFESHGDQ